MRWKKGTNYIPAIVFTIGYIIVAIFLLMGTSHPPSINTPNAAPNVFPTYPWVSFLYLLFAVVITWGAYFSVRGKKDLLSFLISILVGIVMIIVGIILWVTATY